MKVKIKTESNRDSKLFDLIRINGSVSFKDLVTECSLLGFELVGLIEELEILVEAEKVAITQSSSGVKYYRLPGERIEISKTPTQVIRTESSTESLLDTLTKSFPKEEDVFTVNLAAKASGLKAGQVKDLIAQMLEEGSIKEAGKGKYMGKTFTKYKIL